jgi:SAM-dependent methyltransferase
MSKLTIDISQHQAVTALRILYPIWAAVGIFGIQYVPATLIVPGEAAATANNIMANELLFRMGIASSLITQLIQIVAVLVLYQLFKSVNKNNAMLMVIFALVGVPITMLNELNKFAALLLLNNADQMMLFLNLNAQGIFIASVFWGLWLFPLGNLIYRSGYFPRILGVLVIISGFGYMLDSFMHFLLPHYEAIFLQVTNLLYRILQKTREEKMNTEDLGNSRILNLIFKPAGMVMGSRLRNWFSNSEKILQGSYIQPGQTVLEVGCGTGFFTIPAAEMIGDQGSLIAMDLSSGFIEQVSKKVEAVDLKNVQFVKRDALDTGLDTASIDTVLLFGVIPFPLLPLNRLLPEMHRILKPEGTMAVWLFPPLVHFWVPKSILRSGLFTLVGKLNGVHNFKKSTS